MNNKIIFSFYIDSELKRKFKVKTAEKRTTMSKMITAGIKQYLDMA